jgi:hypothetical protein
VTPREPHVPAEDGRADAGRPERSAAWRHRADAPGVYLLLLGCVAVYGRSLTFAPADADDLILLSKVAGESNPLAFFISDWGLGNNCYRPLHTALLWLTYRVAGVWAAPHQLLNLALHLAVAVLLYDTVRRNADATIGLLAAGLALVSIYTLSPASWVSDRPTLIVALCLLLLVRHLDRAERPDGGYLAALSAVALLGKESGILVPGLAAAAVLTRTPRDGRLRTLVPIGLVLLGYAGVRALAFGMRAASYSENGYLLAFIPYDERSLLPAPLQIVAAVENVAKSALAVVAPLVTSEGRLITGQRLLIVLPHAAATAALVAMSTRRPLTRLQRDALLIVVLNALVHGAVFRYRTLYLAQLAACVYVAAAAGDEPGRRRRNAVAALALLLSVVRVDAIVSAEQLARRRAVETRSGPLDGSDSRIDPAVVDEVIRLYGR